MDLVNLSMEVMRGLQYLVAGIVLFMLMVEADVWPLSTKSTLRVIMYVIAAFIIRT